MKRFFVLSVLIMIISGAVSALDLGVGLYFDYTRYAQLSAQGNDMAIPENPFITFRIDVPLNRNLGLLVIPGISFTDEESVELPEGEPDILFNNVHWNGQAGPVYHIFGYRSFLDPYVSAGIGCSGMHSIGSDDIVSYDNWWYHTQLGIYGYALAGLNLVLDRSFYLGVSIQNNFYSFNPTPLMEYDNFEYGVRISCGTRL